jgi:acid phosphatase type 7
VKLAIPTLAIAAVAAIIFVLGGGWSFAQANEVTYLSEADVRVQESDPDGNYALRGLWTDGTTSDRKESYVRFRVSGDLTEEALKSAKLRVHAYEGTDDGPAIYQTTNDWSEGGITWANRPPTVGPEIDDAGGVAKGSWVEYDVSGLVDGDGTYSFILRSGSADLAKFDAWEGRYQPELVLNIEGDPVLVGAGDIASGETDEDAATARLIRDIPGTVFAVGDVVYESGSIEDFERYYHPTWGTEKARTKPSPGNHEYVGGDPKQYGRGYFDYFGAVAAEDNGGSYSYNLGEWHVVSLNTGQCYGEKEGDGSFPNCGPGDPMIEWLERDLAANDARCTLAYFHHARWSSGIEHGNEPGYTKAIWNTLYEHRADVAVSGHDHDYERFAPQDTEGNLDEERGIRQFVVGTGGRSLREFGKTKANSEVHSYNTYGVIKFTLHPDGYDWEFMPVEGGAFKDAGSDQCH